MVSEEHDATVEYNKTTETIIENELKKGCIEVVKIDADEKEIRLQGVKFNVLDENGKILETIETDENGIAETKRYQLRDFESLILQEIETLETYELNDEPKKIILEEGKISIIFENIPKKGNLQIIKVDEYNNSIAIEGAKFDLYEDTNRNGKIDSEDKFLETITTNAEGIAISQEYRIDRAYLGIETYVSDAYFLDTTVFSFSLEWNKTIERIIQNKPKTMQIKVIKTDSKDKTIKIPNVEFKIYEDVNQNGKIDEEDILIDTITTNNEGIALSKDNSYADKSKILKISKQYILFESKHNIKYIYDEITEVLNYTEYLTNGEYQEGLQFDIEIENTPIEVAPKAEKTDRFTGKPLEGAEFDIYEDTNGNGVFDKEDKKVRHYVTDSQGRAEIEPLRCNTYFWFETKAPLGYTLDENVYTFKVEKQNQIIILKSEDKIIENDVDLYKKANNDSIKYGIKKDEGVPETYFALYLIDENGEIIDFAKDKYGNYIGEKIIIDGKEYYAVVTDNTGKVQVTVPYGKYLFREIKSHDLFLNDSKDSIIDVLDDGKQVTIEFYDTAVNLELDISKTGINQAQPKDEIRYDFPNLINKSNVALNDFTWEDHLPSKYTKIKSLYTGTWNEELIYHIFYKTNKNDYREYGNGYSTLENHFIDFESLGLNDENDEYITDFKIVFGTVKSGFTYEEAPFIFVVVDEDIQEDDEWTNKTRLTGNYTDINGNLTELTDEDEHTTITYKEKLKITTLPRTGTDISTSTIVIRVISVIIVLAVGILLKKKLK